MGEKPIMRPVDPGSMADLAYLYAVLSRRLDEPGTNISHQSLPTFEKHCDFVRGQPYAGHYIVTQRGLNVGVGYVTRDHEIGLWIAPEHRREGIGSYVLGFLMGKHTSDHWLAHVNAANAASRAFFEGYGFKPFSQARIVGRGTKIAYLLTRETIRL